MQVELVRLQKTLGVTFVHVTQGEVIDETIERVWGGTDGQYLSFNFNVMDSSVRAKSICTVSNTLNADVTLRLI